MPRTRIGITDRDGKGSTTAWVVWGYNHLNQRRQFAYDGRTWYYQPTTRENFIPAAGDIPQNVLGNMASEHGQPIKV